MLTINFKFSLKKHVFFYGFLVKFQHIAKLTEDRILQGTREGRIRQVSLDRMVDWVKTTYCSGHIRYTVGSNTRVLHAHTKKKG